MLRSRRCESNEKETETGVACAVSTNLLSYKLVEVPCGILSDVMRRGDTANGTLESK